MLLPRTENGERKGFLRGHSCCTALVKLSDDWRAALGKKESIGGSLICLTDSNVLDAMGPTRTGCPCAAGFRRVAC